MPATHFNAILATVICLYFSCSVLFAHSLFSPLLSPSLPSHIEMPSSKKNPSYFMVNECNDHFLFSPPPHSLSLSHKSSRACVFVPFTIFLCFRHPIYKNANICALISKNSVDSTSIAIPKCDETKHARAICTMHDISMYLCSTIFSVCFKTVSFTITQSMADASTSWRHFLSFFCSSNYFNVKPVE